jgi:hypothetical protein
MEHTAKEYIQKYIMSKNEKISTSSLIMDIKKKRY